MITDSLGALLQELGKALKIPDLHPDRNNSCLISLPNGLKVQIELDKSGSCITIGTDIGFVPPGRYRENVFREALKANGQPYPQRNGILAYSRQADRLVLFEMLSLKDLTGEKIASALALLNEKALIWKEALARGDVPVVSSSGTSRPMGMFGMRP